MPTTEMTCPQCAAQMPAEAAFCPGCGRPMRTETIAPVSKTSPDGKVGPLSVNLAGALAYFTFIPAIVFLLVNPYRKNRFVRFHSIQSLLFCGVIVLLGPALKLPAVVLFLIPVVGPLLVAVVYVVAALAAVLLWLVLVVKAFQGEMFKLPVLGDFAERH
ncbi:MAG TPA: zinc-ribbon domain-containing protein [Candidatus Binatia bacterium]|nr:zinc-ribbon domain-containing protein [Candidatus Binatia bacterium]